MLGRILNLKVKRKNIHEVYAGVNPKSQSKKKEHTRGLCWGESASRDTSEKPQELPKIKEQKGEQIREQKRTNR